MTTDEKERSRRVDGRLEFLRAYLGAGGDLARLSRFRFLEDRRPGSEQPTVRHAG
jgi:hypothetical protein